MAFPDLSPRRIVFLGALGAGSVLAVTTIAFATIQRDRLNAGQWVRHTWEVVAKLEEVRGDLYRLRLAQLEQVPTDELQAELQADLRVLRRLVLDNPRQVSATHQIEETYKSGNEAAAEAHLSDAITTEYTLLRQRSAWLEEATFLLSASGVGLAGAFLGAIALVSLLAHRNYKLAEQRSEMIAVFAHDIRSPLAGILGRLELLARKFPQEANSIEKYIALGNFIVQLLEDARFLGSRSIELDIEAVDITAFGQDLTNIINVLAVPSRRDVSVRWLVATSCPTPLIWQVDRELLRRIFYNLLSNAIAYSPPNSTVIFSVSCKKNTLTFKIEDQGIGIPEKDKSTLFHPFKRGSNVGARKGSGLGLAIAHQCVKACGGKIWFEDRIPPPGTVFFVSFAARRS
jgi:signal transduction histidine kinase